MYLYVCVCTYVYMYKYVCIYVTSYVADIKLQFVLNKQFCARHVTASYLT
jgi:hypothetical protein